MIQDTALYHNTDRITSVFVYCIGQIAHEYIIADTTSPVHFGREPLNQCSNIDIVCNLCEPFDSNTITAKEATIFNVTLGPSGGDRGYTGITGKIFKHCKE